MANTFKFGNGKWAVKDGYALAYNDENGNFKPLPFNFTRSTSATRVNKDGLIETVGSNEPRIDFLNDSNGALLLEPSRTNSLLQSNQFDTTWTTTNATVTSEQVGVGGSTDAWKIEKTAANGYIRHIGISVVNGSVSVFAKKGASNWLRLGTSSGNIETYFDLENGIIGNKGNLVDTSDIVDMGDGWYRCSFSYTGTATGVYLYPADNNGDTSQTSGFVYLQYCQIEVGSYPTSYIPTQGSAVTVVAETCIDAGNDQVINSTEGVLYFEGSALADDGTNRWISLSDGTANNNIVIRISDTNNILSRLFKSGSPVGSAIIDATTDIKTDMKVAIVYNDTSHSLFVNGIKIGTQIVNSSYTLGTLNALNFDSGSGVSDFYGNCKDLQVYNTALTDAELIELTTI